MRLYNITVKDIENNVLDNFNLTVGDYELPTIKTMLMYGLEVIEKYDNIDFLLSYSDPLLGDVTTTKPLHI